MSPRIFVISLLLAAPVSAARVAILDPAGPARAPAPFKDTLVRALGGHEVELRQRPGKWSPRRLQAAPALAGEAEAAGVEMIVDAVVTGKKKKKRTLHVLAVDRTGVVRYSSRTPFRSNEAVARIATAVAGALDEVLGTTADAAPTYPAAARLELEEPPAPVPATGALPGPLDLGKVIEPSRRSSWRASLHAGGGMMGFAESRTASGGDVLTVRVPAAFTAAAAASLQLGRIGLTLDGRRYAASLRYKEEDRSGEGVELSSLILGGTLDAAFRTGPVAVVPTLGFEYQRTEQRATGEATAAAFAPASGRILLRAGAALRIGTFGEPGVAGEVGAAYAPLGSAKEGDVIAAGVRALQAGGRLRYSFADSDDDSAPYAQLDLSYERGWGSFAGVGLVRDRFGGGVAVGWSL